PAFLQVLPELASFLPFGTATLIPTSKNTRSRPLSRNRVLSEPLYPNLYNGAACPAAPLG
ncbi:hypothetical protein, partial [Paenibacillus whitsoniae]|uniref:hypothetical protein n=1 Tax=Paenibacillus whitsoniae TaxID=2496558 RepID=UPI0019D31123